MKRFGNALFRWKRAFRFFSTVLFCALFVLGCGRRAPRADLVFINGGEPETLDPAVAVGQLDGRVSESLFEGLLQFDPQTGDAIPAIAERYDLSLDGLVYTFHLRTNALWSTGEPITAHDFVWSWRRVLAPETAADYAGQLFYVRNAEAYCTGKTNAATGQRYTAEDVAVRALDSRTLRVELIAPTAFFPDICAFHTLAAMPRKAVEKYGDRWVRAPDTPFSGAFTLEFWRVNDRIRVRKNPRYWNAAEVQISTADFLPQTDPTFGLNAFLQGDADLIFDKRRVPAELLDVLRQQSYAHPFDYLCTFFYRYKVTKKPFDDPRVRKALAMAVDKRRIVERITRGGERPATHLTPPGIRGYEPPAGLDYDPAGARKLLAEAGYPEGKGFPLFRYLTPGTVQTVQTAVELREMWERELGLRMEIQQLEWKVFLREQSQTNYDLSYSSWIGDYKDPNTFLDLFMERNGNNRTGWASARYDALMREGNSQVEPAKRWQLLRQAETILVRDELPIVPLYFEKGILFFDPEKIEGAYGNLVDQHPLSAMRRKQPPGKLRTVIGSETNVSTRHAARTTD
jgi:oligopeptide transport system substrate-binding protein